MLGVFMSFPLTPISLIWPPSDSCIEYEWVPRGWLVDWFKREVTTGFPSSAAQPMDVADSDDVLEVTPSGDCVSTNGSMSGSRQALHGSGSGACVEDAVELDDDASDTAKKEDEVQHVPPASSASAKLGPPDLDVSPLLCKHGRLAPLQVDQARLVPSAAVDWAVSHGGCKAVKRLEVSDSHALLLALCHVPWFANPSSCPFLHGRRHMSMGRVLAAYKKPLRSNGSASS